MRVDRVRVRRLKAKLDAFVGGSFELLVAILFVIVASFLLFAGLLLVADKVNRQDNALEQSLEGALLAIARMGGGEPLSRSLIPDMDSAMSMLLRYGDFGSDDFQAAAAAVAEHGAELRVHVAMPDGHPDGPLAASADAVHVRMAASLSTDIEAFLPLLRTHRDSIRSSFAFLVVMSALGFASVAVYVVTLWARLRESRLGADWARKGLQRALEAEEAERRRIARDLHDDAAQDLAAARMLCERARDADSLESARRRAAEAADLLGSSGAKLRTLAMDLRPPGLEQGGLVAALESLCARHRAIRDVVIDFQASPAASKAAARAGDRRAIHVYRIVQEALANVAKHAPGNRVELRLDWLEGTGVPGLRFLVRDFPSAPSEGRREPPLPRSDVSMSSGTGLGIMAERASFLGGWLKAEFSADSATITLFIPGDPPQGGIPT